jgi:hypothetical protein
MSKESHSPGVPLRRIRLSSPPPIVPNRHQRSQVYRPVSPGLGQKSGQKPGPAQPYSPRPASFSPHSYGDYPRPGPRSSPEGRPPPLRRDELRPGSVAPFTKRAICLSEVQRPPPRSVTKVSQADPLSARICSLLRRLSRRAGCHREHRAPSRRGTSLDLNNHALEFEGGLVLQPCRGVGGLQAGPEEEGSRWRSPRPGREAPGQVLMATDPCTVQPGPGKFTLR